MKTSIFILCLVSASVCHAQHEHESKSVAKKWAHIPVFRQAFSDSIFKDKEIQVATFTVPAGATDPIAHQHDCHLVGYILEGEVITKLKDKPAQHLRKGDVFYEFPNEIHESIQNPHKQNDAKILLYYLFTKNAVLYKKLE